MQGQANHFCASLTLPPSYSSSLTPTNSPLRSREDPVRHRPLPERDPSSLQHLFVLPPSYESSSIKSCSQTRSTSSTATASGSAAQVPASTPTPISAPSPGSSSLSPSSNRTDLSAYRVKIHNWSGVSLDEFPALAAWLARIEARPAVKLGLNVPTKIIEDEIGRAHV